HGAHKRAHAHTRGATQPSVREAVNTPNSKDAGHAAGQHTSEQHTSARAHKRTKHKRATTH
ncbi:hypothetical protein, partial [Schaalia sp. lx-260]|uniref:hypothetical protein n=1 Tax=Schaalia sp. lx-260 TaxID=2899082 RepID=UPI001E3D14BF